MNTAACRMLYYTSIIVTSVLILTPKLHIRSSIRSSEQTTNSPAVVPLCQGIRLSSVLFRSKVGSESRSAASDRTPSMIRDTQLDVMDSMKFEYTAGILIDGEFIADPTAENPTDNMITKYNTPPSRISLSTNGGAAALLACNLRYAVNMYRIVCKSIGGANSRHVFWGVGAMQPRCVRLTPGPEIDTARRSLKVRPRITISLITEATKKKTSSARARLLCR